MPSFYHLLFYNFQAYDNDNEQAFSWNTSMIGHNLGIFKPYYKRFRKAYQRPGNYGIPLCRRRLLFLLNEIEYQKSYRALRKEFQNNRRKYYSQLVQRDKLICKHCGTTDRITIDHIRPLIKGGKNELSNFQFLCVRCNSKKGGKII